LSVTGQRDRVTAMAQDEGKSQDRRPRGRPRRPASDDPVAEIIRTRREALELSYQALADRVGVSPSHIFHIECGDKVPSEEIAVAIARAIGEDLELFRAWARARGRADLATTMEATDQLDRRLAQRGIMLRPGMGAFALAQMRRMHIAGRPEPGGEGTFFLRGGQEIGFTQRARSLDDVESAPLVRSPEGDGPAHRIRIPIVPAGEDPGEGTAAGGGEMLRLRVDELAALERLDRPFAYRITSESAARFPGIPIGALMVMTRRVLPIEPGTIHAVRLDGRVVLARVLWNGRELLLLPSEGASDFRVLPAPDEAALAGHIVGAMTSLHMPDR